MAGQIRGSVDGHPLQSSFMALCNGTYKLPIRWDLLDAVGKSVGDTVSVRLRERL